MHTIAIVSRKGGAGKTTLAIHLAAAAGKTTLAIHLAAAAEQAGLRTAILDLDPQASAAGWADIRPDPRPVVRVCLPHRLSHGLDEFADCDLVIIDTAPHAETGALAAARASDLVLIPCRPAVFDLHAVGAAVDIANIAGTPALAVLNAIPPRGRTAEQARTALAEWGIEVATTTLTHRQAFVHALARGQTASEFEPSGKASAEILALRDLVLKHARAGRVPA